jgi:hypothetical protein
MMPTFSSREPRTIVAGLLLTLVCFSPLFAGGTPTNGTELGNLIHLIIGPTEGIGGGDFISSTDGLSSSHNYFVEVPPGTSELNIELFDAEIFGAGETPDEDLRMDEPRSGNTSATYSLIDPAGTTLESVFVDEGTSPELHNAWGNVFTSTLPLTNPTAGHWTVNIQMGGSNDRHAFGIRAYETSPNTGDTELNVYYQVGNHGRSRTYQDYPYVTAGCSCTSNDFDYDTNGNYTLTSPSGTFSQTMLEASSSSDSSWNTETYTGWNSDDRAIEYGIWQFDVTVNSDNLSNFYMLYDSDISPAPDSPNPASSLPTGSFRVYLPTDANAAPVKPVVEQSLDVVMGSTPNPPVVGMTTQLRVTIQVENPTPHDIIFAAPSQVVTATLPADTTTTYEGTDQVSQGTVTSQPGIGASSGTLTWNPGTVVAGSTALLSYFINFTPTSVTRTLITGTPASDGTTAVFIDETGNTSQARAEVTFGPMCELAVTPLGTPLFVELEKFEAVSNGVGQPVSLSWTTAMEVDNAGFHIYRAADNAGRSQQLGERLTSSLIPAQGNGTGASYQFVDATLLTAADEARAYLLEDIDLNGTRTMHGPFRLTDPSGQVSEVEDWTHY